MKGLSEIYIPKTSTHIETGKDGISRKVTRTFNHKVKAGNLRIGLRFVNDMVDSFLVYVILHYITVYFPVELKYTLPLLGFILFVFTPVYYIITEYYFQQTLGKLITKSVVINDFAERPDLRTIILRTVIRYIPFEPFSFLGSSERGWHDRWSKTYVVPKDEVPRLKKIIQEHNEPAGNEELLTTPTGI